MDISKYEGVIVLDCVRIMPGGLNGSIDIPPSKSLCHRAIIASGLSDGISNIKNVMFSDDILATCGAMESLGTDIWRQKNSLRVKGNNFLNSIKNEIDCLESGSTLRFTVPLALLTAENITFKGRGRLKDRPLGPYYSIFEKQGIYYSGKDGLPLTVCGMLSPGDYEIEGDISSQFITGLMFALPLLYGDSRIIITTRLESKAYVDLTIDMLERFSINIENKGYREFFIKGHQKYMPSDYTVEGDFSQGAFWMAAGLMGGEVECRGLNYDSLQGDRVIVDIIERMGGDIQFAGDKIVTRSSKMRGIIIDASECPDLVPIISVLAALSMGRTEIVNAGRLRIKESDRLKAIACELNKLGADVKERKDGLVIEGRDTLKGGIVDSWNDHRIAMALAIASIRCTGPLVMTNPGTVKKSYPDFFKDFSVLGGNVNEWSMGH